MTTTNNQTVSAKERLAVGFIRIASYFPLSFSRALGTLVGVVMAHTNSRFANVTRKNIELCLPELSAPERERLAKRSMIETCQLTLEVPAIWLRDYQTWLKPKIKSVHNQALLEAELAKGQGVILVAPHLGNWEIFSGFMAEIAPMMVMFQPPAMRSVGDIMVAAREQQGGSLAPTSSRGVAKLLKFLRSGGLTAILPDQVPETSGGEFSPFFGQQALTMTLVQSLRKRTDCRLLACYAERVQGGFRVVFKAVDDDCYSPDSAVAMAGLNRTVEACVRNIPEQYQWEYKRFKSQPKGAKKIY
jgi:KDO2-lipid IV(A) lauroyltransferase